MDTQLYTGHAGVTCPYRHPAGLFGQWGFCFAGLNLAITSSYQVAGDGSNPLKMAKETKNPGTVALLEKYLQKEGYSEQDKEKMTNAKVYSQQEQAAQMQKMMSDPSFMDTMQKLAGMFGGDQSKLQDVLKGFAGNIDPSDPNAMKKVLKDVADGKTKPDL